ncbi:MAG: hypothetical protein H6918_06030 [Sphingomonadaceae bacterium]|nr:hypothetical protein [Sphingomonadaceae bacterium]
MATRLSSPAVSTKILIRRLNLALTGLGLAVFTLLLAYVNFSSDQLGVHLKDIVVSQTSEQVSDALSERGIYLEPLESAPIGKALAKGLRTKMDEIQQGLDAGLDRMVANVLASACKLDCNRREEAAAAVRSSMESSIVKYGMASDKIEQLILGKYEKVIGELRTDLNIFAGSNAALLALSFVLSLVKQGAARHLLPISLALTLSTALMSIWYLLGQNWAMTVIFSEYWGWGYPLAQGILAALLLDIAFNSGRITTEFFNRILDAIGSSIQLVPC